jgi:hypothetical protein
MDKMVARKINKSIKTYLIISILYNDIFDHLFIVAIGDRDNYLVFSRGYTINKIPYVQSDDNVGEILIYKSGKF